jgi:hypothetical protein
MKIQLNEKTANYDITGLAWDEGYRILLALKKVSDLLGKAQYSSEYHKQEAARLNEKYSKIIAALDGEIPKGVAKGLDEEILELI